MKKQLLLSMLIIAFVGSAQEHTDTAPNTLPQADLREGKALIEQKIIEPYGAKPAADVKTVETKVTPADTTSKLPANHPDIAGNANKMGLKLPVNHPNIDGAGTAMRLPSPEEKRLLAAVENQKTAEAYKALADYYLLNNRADKAEKAFKQAIMKSPENPKLFIGMALAQLHTGEHETAMVMLERALEIDPEMPAAQKLKVYFEEKEKRQKSGTYNPHHHSVRMSEKGTTNSKSN